MRQPCIIWKIIKFVILSLHQPAIVYVYILCFAPGYAGADSVCISSRGRPGSPTDQPLSLSSLLTSTSTSASSSAVVRVMQGEFGASLVLALIRRGQKLAESSQDPPNRAYEEWYVCLPVYALTLTSFS